MCEGRGAHGENTPQGTAGSKGPQQALAISKTETRFKIPTPGARSAISTAKAAGERGEPQAADDLTVVKEVIAFITTILWEAKRALQWIARFTLK